MSDMRYYASKLKMPDYGFSPDADFPVINIEKGGLNMLLSKVTGGEEGAEIPVYSLYAGERPNVVPGERQRPWSGSRLALWNSFPRKSTPSPRRIPVLISNAFLPERVRPNLREGRHAHASTPHLA